ncbi:pilus assembly protein TadG-related protein [Propionivibrio limicola]|uniref:pilus assembly protein TadG-related protein n=1 Tax=Propionivibrio limicola TaxID=167645 RepID=UPI001B882737|nr:pilus assembly protein TadG-related protein [Propionivibrio limicola]
MAIIVGLSIAVLIGFAGLALDAGQLYVTKTELQNAADACALSAAYELTGDPVPAENFTRAENAGITVATQNRVGFQGANIVAGSVAVTFGSSLSGGSWLSASSNPPGTTKYVRCVIDRPNIPLWFMRVLGIDDADVNALATATLTPAQTNCAIPMALCSDRYGGSAPDFGYVVGQWYSMNFKETGGGSGMSDLTGNFRWIDFDPSSGTPGCSGGGAQELACLLEGAGQCNLPANNLGSCAGASPGNPIPGCVGQTGNITSLGKAFNTRFGIYQGGGGVTTGDLTSAPPDFTGFAYNTTTWPLGENAYNGTSGTTDNFLASRAANTPVQADENPGGSSSASQTQLHDYGADRRLVTLPFVPCADFESGQQSPIRGYACILMLSPYKKSGQDVTVSAEYLGASNAPGSPCATSGAVGGPSSVGPMVPALVQ